jgi:uncharacterized protein (TIGR03437 family)
MPVRPRHLRLLPLCSLLLFAAAADAQQPPAPSAATVGVPYSVDFGAGIRQALQSIPQNVDGISFTFGFTTAGGTLPPGLTLASNGVLSGTPTTPGTYPFRIDFNYSFTFSIPVPVSVPTSGSIPIASTAITVTGAPAGPQFSVQPGLISFQFTAGAAAASQVLSVINTGNTASPFSASATTRTGGTWLTASAGGTAPAFKSGSLQVTADPTGLLAGTYAGNVAVTVGSSTFNIPVVITVTSAQQVLSLSQTGLTFHAVAGGGGSPPQTFSVLNGGTGTLSWTTQTSTLPAGGSWLSASPANGSSGAGASPAVQVAVNPAGLAAGDYYGQVQVSAPTVTNSPQTVSIVLTVAPSNTQVNPIVLPTGLIFVGVAGGSNPAAKSFSITNLSSQAVTYTATPFFDQGKNWYSPQPATGAVNPGKPASIAVQPVVAGLPAGIYTGDLTISYKETNTTQHVAILLVMVPAGTVISTKTGPSEPRLASGCTPAKLQPVFTQLGQSFTTTAAWPTSIEVTVVDDCGAPLTAGSVVTTFSSGDPLLALTSLDDGRWAGTWQARNVTTSPVSITANAQLATPPLQGTASIGGNSQANATAPIVKDGGALSAVSLVANTPLAPGSLAVVYGTNLASGVSTADPSQWGTQLNGTQAIIAGRAMPLYSTNNGQINALIPFDVPVNATHQLIIQRANTYSVPVNVTVAAAGPAVFTQDNSGAGPGVVYGINTDDGTQFLIDENDPVSAGDSIVISCAGLGVVDPPVPSGTPAPDSPQSSTTNVVTVTIGGQDAPVTFSGLTPESIGVYQINATVPDGLTPGDVPLVVTVAGQSSPPVTITVQ